jgi:Cft2 family RNA processing exonuclease
VSGSCHLLETSSGLFLVDCGLFFDDVKDQNKRNEEFPFEPRDVKAVFLTHAHVDHNGRLPLLFKRGFRGPVYCTDATRDINQVMLEMSLGINEGSEDQVRLYDRDDLAGLLGKVEAVPYNRKLEKHGLTFRLTDAGHILGSAMIEVWVDGVKFLFSGDMGPDHTPVLCRATQHREADVVLVESTYGPVPREEFTFEEFGRQIMKVISGGGSVLLPAFVLHKTQTLLHVFLIRQGVEPRGIVASGYTRSKPEEDDNPRRHSQYCNLVWTMVLDADSGEILSLDEVRKNKLLAEVPWGIAGGGREFSYEEATELERLWGDLLSHLKKAELPEV